MADTVALVARGATKPEMLSSSFATSGGSAADFDEAARLKRDNAAQDGFVTLSGLAVSRSFR
jgi:hypothetical protein